MITNGCTGRTRALLVAITIVWALSLNTGWSQIGGTTVTQVLPQIAVGTFDGGLTRFSTVIEIVNANPVSVTLSGSFFRQDGTASNLVLSTSLTTFPTITNGVLPTITLDPNRVLVISATTLPSTTPPTTGVVAWGSIVTGSNVSITTFLELRNATTNALLSRVGLPTSPPNITKFVVPRASNPTTGLELGFALVNTNFFTTSLTATLFNAAGATVATRNFTMPGNSHLSAFAGQFFGLVNEPAGNSFQFIVFDSVSAPFLAAAGIEFEGFVQSNVPVQVLR